MARRTLRGVAFRYGLRALVLLIATLVALAYSGGISYAHWIAATESEGSIRTGSLTVEVDNPETEFEFDCETLVFPHHALSFIRFWAPDQVPDPLKAAGTGAVKIEEDGNEKSDGYWVEPDSAAIGDVAVAHLGASTVAITDWVPKPGEPGEYMGFAYSITGGPVVVDAKADGDLWRQTIDGSGIWSLGESCCGPVTLVESCAPEEIETAIDIVNTGSVPAMPYITLLGDPDPESCAAFTATIRTEDGDILGSGSLCGLYGPRRLVVEQIDPGDTVTIAIVFRPVLEDSGGMYAEDFILEVLFTQWNSSIDTSYGWIDATDVPFILTITTTPSPDCDDVCNPASNASNGDEAEAGGEPGDGSEEDPDEGTGKQTELDDAADVASLSGSVWLDLDGDTALAADGTEHGVSSVLVTLFDEQGHELRSLKTDGSGGYELNDLEPGRYTMSFRAPPHHAFSGVRTDSPKEAVLDDGLVDDLAALWTINPSDVVVSDVVVAVSDPSGVVGRTSTFELFGGGNVGLADAALVALTEEPPPTQGGTEDPPPEEGAEQPVDNTDDAAKEPETNPFEEQPPDEPPPEDSTATET